MVNVNKSSSPPVSKWRERIDAKALVNRGDVWSDFRSTSSRYARQPSRQYSTKPEHFVGKLAGGLYRRSGRLWIGGGEFYALENVHRPALSGDVWTNYSRPDHWYIDSAEFSSC